MKLDGPSAWWQRLTRGGTPRRASGHDDFADMGTAFGLEASLATDSVQPNDPRLGAGWPDTATPPEAHTWLRPR